MVSQYMRSGRSNYNQRKVKKRNKKQLFIYIFGSLLVLAILFVLFRNPQTKEAADPKPVKSSKNAFEINKIDSTKRVDADEFIEISKELLDPVQNKYTIRRNDTLAEVFSNLGVSDSQKFELIASLGKVFPVTKIRPGHTLDLNSDSNGSVNSFTYKVSPIEIYEVKRQLYSYNSNKIDIPIDVKKERIEVTLNNSLYESLLEAGESPTLIGNLVDILAWDVDFFADPRKNDEITIVVEKKYVDGEFISYGKILAVNYFGSIVKQKAFYFEEVDGYFDESGKSLARNFLKSPVMYSRISSRFGNRRHPVTHSFHKHLGTDFAAPTGAPVWSMADGRVTQRAYTKFNGNYIEVKHNNGYSTYYLHLSGFAKGLKVGQRIKQKQLIGYVGATGRSTGPHLHLSVKYGGKFIDPLKLKRVKRTSLNSEQLAIFNTTLPERLAEINGNKTEQKS